MAHMPEVFMRAALQLAEEALGKGELPIGSVVVLNDRIIASAHCVDKQARRFLAHAEFIALDQADRLRPFPGERRDARLFTTLEPCLMCMGAAMSFFIGEVTYALESPTDGAVDLVKSWRPGDDTMPSYRVPDIFFGLLREESKDLFRRYVEMHPPDNQLWKWAKSLTELP